MRKTNFVELKRLSSIFYKHYYDSMIRLTDATLLDEKDNDAIFIAFRMSMNDVYNIMIEQNHYILN